MNTITFCIYHSHYVLQSQSQVCRVTGYELTPLRVDLEASVEQPQLHLEADTDTGLHFTYPASILLQGDQVCSIFLFHNHRHVKNT